MKATSVVSTSHFKQNTNLLIFAGAGRGEQIRAMGGGRS